MSEKVPVILHYPDYRGDHSADALRVLMVPETMTVSELRQEAEKVSGGKAWIEVGAIENTNP